MKTNTRPKQQMTNADAAATIAAIWAGLFGFSFMASYLLPGQLFALILVCLSLGVVLTAVVLYFANKRWIEYDRQMRDVRTRYGARVEWEGWNAMEEGRPMNMESLDPIKNIEEGEREVRRRFGMDEDSEESKK